MRSYVPGRESLTPMRRDRTAWTNKEATAYFPLLSLSLFSFLFVRYNLLCQSLFACCRRADAATGANATAAQHSRSKPSSVSHPASQGHKSATAPEEVLERGHNRSIRPRFPESGNKYRTTRH